jgi:hypothetical protein
VQANAGEKIEDREFLSDRKFEELDVLKGDCQGK